ncbi:MAG: CHAP domain-containing protein [Spirochaetota bacterium]
MRTQPRKETSRSSRGSTGAPLRVPITVGALCTLLLGGCVSLAGQPEVVDRPPAVEAERTTSARLSARQLRILDAAERMLETQRFVVDGYHYNSDCTGTILAIYAMAGVRLVDLFGNYVGNGVQRLHSIAADHALLYDAQLPEPGDLIFWDNTYDKNGDSEWNDWLTHVGLVLDVSPDGTIDYLHHHYTDGVVRARMNLTDPQTHVAADGVVVNSPMRMRSHRHLNPDEWLASHLYRELGAMHRIEL